MTDGANDCVRIAAATISTNPWNLCRRCFKHRKVTPKAKVSESKASAPKSALRIEKCLWAG